MLGIAIIYILIFLIIALIGFSVMQIKMAGMNVKDFCSFINAVKQLDNLYKYSRRYEKLSFGEQIIFLSEAEKIFSAFDKVPSMIWEDEYQKYDEVLNTYRKIRLLRWSEVNV